MILALAERNYSRGLLNRLTTKTLNFCKMVLLYVSSFAIPQKTITSHMNKKNKKLQKVVGTLDEYVRAWRKASRADEIASHGRAVSFARVHVSKKVYNRKRDRKIEW